MLTVINLRWIPVWDTHFPPTVVWPKGQAQIPLSQKEPPVQITWTCWQLGLQDDPGETKYLSDDDKRKTESSSTDLLELQRHKARFGPFDQFDKNIFQLRTVTHRCR